MKNVKKEIRLTLEIHYYWDLTADAEVLEPLDKKTNP